MNEHEKGEIFIGDTVTEVERGRETRSLDHAAYFFAISLIVFDAALILRYFL